MSQPETIKKTFHLPYGVISDIADLAIKQGLTVDEWIMATILMKTSITMKPFTAKFIGLWYEYLRKPLCFDCIDEFLMAAVRQYTLPYMDRVTPGIREKFSKLYDKP